ncbi:MAG: hypothetical protein C4536_02320 [Actinobacteria bacterium]|nr:MAG: hypothetical protein C4536_02320 [Actinomycetota bacterium]
MIMRGRRNAATVVVVILFAALVAIPGCTNAKEAEPQPEEAADRTLLGLQVFGVPEQVAPSYREGFRNFRVEIPWSYVQPDQLGFNWSASDELINAILAEGCESILLLLGGPLPEWARDPQYGEFSNRALPQDLGDWFAYCAAVAERYGPVVDFYEVWNEPGWDRDSEVTRFGTYHFGGQVETDYLPLLQLGHAAIKEKDPNASVICGALMYTLEDDPDVGTENYTLLFDDLNRPGQEVSIRIEADEPIVADRVTGADNGEAKSSSQVPAEEAAARTEWDFPQGHIGSSIQEYLNLENPGSAEARASVIFMMDRGEVFSREVILPPGSAESLDLNRFIGFHGCCDMVSVHPYKSPKFWGPFYANVVSAIRSMGAEQEVVTSEAGWPHYSDNDPAAFSEQYQADAIGALGVGGLFDAGCRKIWVFRDVDEYPGTSWDGNYYGLFSYEGQPYPAWSSYEQWQQQLPRYPRLPSSLP